MEVLVKNVIQPLSTRLGTMSAGIVVGLGASTQTADHVSIAISTVVTAFVLVVVDLFTARLARKEIVRKALGDGNL